MVQLVRNFDYSKTYYRVVHIHPGYYTNDGHLIDQGEGLIDCKDENIEFDDSEGIGRWLFLGKKIKILKVPNQAEVNYNSPLGQGGCYRYNSNLVEVIATINIEDFVQQKNFDLLHLRELSFIGPVDFTRVRSLILNKVQFECNVKLPVKMDVLTILHCRFKQVLQLPASLRTLTLHEFEFEDTALPESRDSLELNQCFGTEVNLGQHANHICLKKCNFKRLSFTDSKINQLEVHDLKVKEFIIPDKFHIEQLVIFGPAANTYSSLKAKAGRVIEISQKGMLY